MSSLCVCVCGVVCVCVCTCVCVRACVCVCVCMLRVIVCVRIFLSPTTCCRACEFHVCVEPDCCISWLQTYYVIASSCGVYKWQEHTAHMCYQLWLLAPLTVVCSCRVQYGCMSFYSSQTLNACVYTDTLLFYGTDLQCSTLLLLLSPSLYISPSLSLPIPLLCMYIQYVRNFKTLHYT